MSQQAVNSKKQQELQIQYSNYKNILQQLAQKIGDVEQEAEEHKYDITTLPRNLTQHPTYTQTLRWGETPSCLFTFVFTASRPVCLGRPLILNNRLVLETLEPLSGERKCFRMINGVLVERTVKEVVPALKTNSEGLKKVLDDLLKQYKSKQDEMDKWKKKNNIQVVQQ